MLDFVVGQYYGKYRLQYITLRNDRFFLISLYVNFPILNPRGAILIFCRIDMTISLIYITNPLVIPYRNRVRVEGKEKFYEKIKREIEQCLNEDLMLILRNFNAHMYMDVTRIDHVLTNKRKK